MTAADSRAHGTDEDIERATMLAWEVAEVGSGGPPSWVIGHLATALAAERDRAAADGQRLRERIEALAAEFERQAGHHQQQARSVRIGFLATEHAGACRAFDAAADSLRAALRDDTGDRR